MSDEKKTYVVRVDATNTKTETVKGCLGFTGNRRPIEYPRGEAIKKARMFNGKIEETSKSFSVTPMRPITMIQIAEDALLYGVEKALKGRESFKDTTELKEVIYQGDVFETILNEEEENFKTLGHYSMREKDLEQLEELVAKVDTDYVMIIKF